MRAKSLCGASILLLVSVAWPAAAAESPLLQAAKTGDKPGVRALLQKHVDVNAAEVDGTTALHWAVNRDDLDTAKLLIGAGASVKAVNRYGVSPLLLACTSGTTAMAEVLLKAGADPNSALPEGETALMTAARSGKVDVIRLLAAHGANVNARETWHGQTALMWAASENHPDTINALAEIGADINARSEGGFTPLLFAARDGKMDAVQTLLTLGANVNDVLQPAPGKAAPSSRYDNAGGVNGGGVNIAGSVPMRRAGGPGGTSALVLAITNAHYTLAKYLVEHGADPNSDAQGWTALHQLAYTRRPNHGKGLPPPEAIDALDTLDLAKLLLQHGANPNARQTREINDGNRNNLNRVGSTPLLLAAKHADLPLMQLLAASGADPSIPTEDGVTVLMAAAGVGIFNVGESAGTNEEASQAVKIAYQLGSTEVNAADKNGYTALHGAALRGANDVVKFLAEKGARFDITTKKEGWTALRVADGVLYTGTVKRADETAALIRQLMKEQGLVVPEKSVNDVAVAPARPAARQ